MSAATKRKKAAPKGKPQKRDQALSELLLSPIRRTMLALGMRAEVTPADAVAPPGSPLDVVVRSIQQYTDLPPLLAVATVMALVSAAMVRAGSTVQWPDGPPNEIDLWIVVLAGSGGGKTFIRNIVSEALGITVPLLPEPASGPAFLDALAAQGGRGLLWLDEYGQHLRGVADGGPKGDLRGLYIRSYDHDPLVNFTRRYGEKRVEHPVLTIFGSSVDITLGACIDPQMLDDGLLARHLFVLAERLPLSVPRYPHEKIVSLIRTGADGLAERLGQAASYEITPEAAAVYDELWTKLVGDLAGSLDAAYVRRITWAAGKYAAIYHVLLGRPGTRIGVTAMRWAWRMVLMHCHAAKLVLASTDRSLAGRIERIADWVEEQRHRGVDVRAPGFARRVIAQFKRDLTSVSEARQIVELVTSGATNAQ